MVRLREGGRLLAAAAVCLLLALCYMMGGSELIIRGNSDIA
jgi:hypothetical protein